MRAVRQAAFVCAIVLCQAGLLAYNGAVHSPAYSELGHLPAGLSHLLFGQFDLYAVNPPLVRMIGAIPVAIARPQLDWTSYMLDRATRPEVECGRDLMQANGQRSFWLYTLARWAILPFVIVGGLTCFLWARDVYGSAAGLLALSIWTFCPNILGHGAQLMPDVPAASCAVAAAYAFYRWGLAPSWARAVIAGGVLGIAELTKFTLLVLFPVFLSIWILDRVFATRTTRTTSLRAEAIMLCTMFGLATAIINVGYELNGSFRQLGTYDFRSAALAGARSPANRGSATNRFRDTWLGCLPLPLPEDYVIGVDAQRYDFERGFPSYLNGQWSSHGWWYFYLYAFAVKVPLGYWCLALLAVGCTVTRVWPINWRDELFVVMPGLAIVILVSSQTGFSIHTRYVFPALPFLFIWVSKVGRAIEARRRVIAVPAALALAWAIVSSLAAYPHSQSYFNELVGGMRHGPEHLLDSNISWGQDLLFLKSWIDKHSEARQLRVAYFGYVDPRIAGLEFETPPMGPSIMYKPADARRTAGPQPGWYAVDVNFIYGNNSRVQDGHGGWQQFEAGLDYTYFQLFDPADTIGGSIRIFHVSLDQSNAVRRRLGLNEIQDIE